MNTHDRVLKHMNQGKEPKGHCEAMSNRYENGLRIADKTFKKVLEKGNEHYTNKRTL